MNPDMTPEDYDKLHDELVGYKAMVLTASGVLAITLDNDTAYVDYETAHAWKMDKYEKYLAAKEVADMLDEPLPEVMPEVVDVEHDNSVEADPEYKGEAPEPLGGEDDPSEEWDEEEEESEGQDWHAPSEEIDPNLLPWWEQKPSDRELVQPKHGVAEVLVSWQGTSPRAIAGSPTTGVGATARVGTATRWDSAGTRLSPRSSLAGRRGLRR